jgi:glutaredoxin-like protein
MLSDREKQKVQEILGQLEGPVTVHYFTQEFECEPCSITHELLNVLTTLSDKLTLKTYEFKDEEEKAKEFGVDQIPAMVLEGKRIYGVRFLGVPAGYEFAALLEDFIDVSRGTTDLSSATKTLLGTLITPLHIQVFVTPTCPYCPRSVRLAHKMAIESDKVKADMVSAMEFPHLAQKYGVMAVPRIVVNNGAVQFEGALPESEFVERVLQAA